MQRIDALKEITRHEAIKKHELEVLRLPIEFHFQKVTEVTFEPDKIENKFSNRDHNSAQPDFWHCGFNNRKWLAGFSGSQKPTTCITYDIHLHKMPQG